MLNGSKSTRHISHLQKGHKRSHNRWACFVKHEGQNRCSRAAQTRSNHTLACPEGGGPMPLGEVSVAETSGTRKGSYFLFSPPYRKSPIHPCVSGDTSPVGLCRADVWISILVSLGEKRETTMINQSVDTSASRPNNQILGKSGWSLFILVLSGSPWRTLVGSWLSRV